MFIAFLGLLLVGLSNFTTSEFIPHLAIGYVAWTLLGGYLMRSTDIFKRHRPYIMQGKASQTDIVAVSYTHLTLPTTPYV